MDRVLSHIPGFRTGTTRHMVTAGAYYLVSVSMMLVSVPLGFMLLSGPFLLLNGYGSMVKYHESKNAKALIALFLAASIWGGGLIGFIVDMVSRQDNAPAEMVALTLTATPCIAPADHTSPATEPPPSPSPPGPAQERAIVLDYREDGIRVQFADESPGDIRLAGIETDETMINQAIAYMGETLPPGSIVYLDQEKNGTDYFVWMGEPLSFGKDAFRQNTLNALLAANGYAAAKPEGEYADILAACQEDAKEARTGLWAEALIATVSEAPAATLAPTVIPTPIPTPEPDPPPPQEMEQTPAPEPEDPPAEPPGGVYFCGSKNSDVFHLSTCGSASQISPENLVIYGSREEAVSRGKRPCKKCNP